MRILVSGAGIAGPTLAYWLLRAGHEVCVVEAAPRLRRGGYVVDFWGAGYDVAEKMGLRDRVHELGYTVREVRLVDARGTRRGGFSTDVLARITQGRFTSLLRSDLSAAIYATIEGRVEAIFGDSIAAIEQDGGRAHVRFEHAPPRDVDLVVGADGLHSRVRACVFGPDASFETSLHYQVAAFDVAGYRPRDELVYVSHSAPGRQVSRFSMRGDRTLFLFVFHDEHLPGPPPTCDAERRSALRRAFADVGWECPRILEAMEGADELYFDRVSQIHMGAWTKQRTALVGDAAACVSLLAGEGSGLAMAEAYVLAGELQRSPADVGAAFACYEARLAAFLRRKQAAAARFASSFAPRSRLGIAFRNTVTRLLRVPLVADFFIGRDLRDDFALPDYAEAADR